MARNAVSTMLNIIIQKYIVVKSLPPFKIGNIFAFSRNHLRSNKAVELS